MASSGKQSSGWLTDRVVEWMTKLGRKRPIFHSEIDFQLALSEVMKECGTTRVRLERRLALRELLRDRRHPEIDIMAVVAGQDIALELKYPKKALAAVVPDGDYKETYELHASGAPDIDAAAIWHDAERIERLIAEGFAQAGAAVALSNYPFWKETNLKVGTKGHAFRLWEGRRVSAGKLRWDGAAKSYATAAVRLSSSYTCAWTDFRTVDGVPSRDGDFRYLILEPTQ